MAYPVPKAQTRVEIKVSNSRFISTLARVSTTEEAKAFIQSIRAEMPDATTMYMRSRWAMAAAWPRA